MKGVLFDLDDTLIDRNQAVVNFAAGSAELLGPDLDVATVVRRVVELDGHGYAGRERFFASLRDEYGLSDAVFEIARDRYIDSVQQRAVVMPGAVELIRRLRGAGYALGVITNGRVDSQSAKLNSTGLGALMDCVMISDAHGAKKPESSIFETVALELGIEPNLSWFVGDHARNDVWGSKQLGFNAAWVHRGRPWPDEIEPCWDVAAENLQEVGHQIGAVIDV